MEEKLIGKEITGKVTEVNNQFLTISFENYQGRLAKNNMNVGKRKKLSDIFTLGYIIKAKVVGKKDNFFVLSQKQERETAKEEVKEKAKTKKESKKPNNKFKNKDKKTINTANTKPTQEEVEEKKQEHKLKDLHKLKYLGNMKISVKKGKKAAIKLSEEKEEKEELIPVPDGLLDKIVKETATVTAEFEKIKKELQDRGYIDEL